MKGGAQLGDHPNRSGQGDIRSWSVRALPVGEDGGVVEGEGESGVRSASTEAPSGGVAAVVKKDGARREVDDGEDGASGGLVRWGRRCAVEVARGVMRFPLRLARVLSVCSPRGNRRAAPGGRLKARCLGATSVCRVWSMTVRATTSTATGMCEGSVIVSA